MEEEMGYSKVKVRIDKKSIIESDQIFGEKSLLEQKSIRGKSEKVLSSQSLETQKGQ